MTLTDEKYTRELNREPVDAGVDDALGEACRIMTFRQNKLRDRGARHWTPTELEPLIVVTVPSTALARADIARQVVAIAEQGRHAAVAARIVLRTGQKPTLDTFNYNTDLRVYALNGRIELDYRDQLPS